MEEILRKLLESELLNEETKKQITEQFKATVEAYLAEERQKLEVEIQAKLTEEFVTAREELAEQLNAKLDEVLDAEFADLKDDISKFRDLEVEHAEKLVEEKEQLAQTLGEQLNELVDKVDAFLEVRLDEEVTELKDDLEQVKKYEFGRRMFEAYEAEFKAFRKADLGEVERELAETSDKLADAEKRLHKLEHDRLSEARNAKLEDLLKPLSGSTKEQMKVILSNVATEKLDEAYKIYIGRVLRETVEDKAKDKPKADKDNVVIVEDKRKPAPETRLVTGNEDKDDEEDEVPVTNDQLLRIRKLAGLSN